MLLHLLLVSSVVLLVAGVCWALLCYVLRHSRILQYSRQIPPASSVDVLHLTCCAAVNAVDDKPSVAVAGVTPVNAAVAAATEPSKHGKPDAPKYYKTKKAYGELAAGA